MRTLIRPAKSSEECLEVSERVQKKSTSHAVYTRRRIPKGIVGDRPEVCGAPVDCAPLRSWPTDTAWLRVRVLLSLVLRHRTARATALCAVDLRALRERHGLDVQVRL